MKFRINFVVRPSVVHKSGLCCIECSITVEGNRFYQRLPRQVKPESWNQSQQKVRGKSPEAVEINNFLNAYKQNLYNLQTKIFQLNLPYNVETFNHSTR